MIQYCTDDFLNQGFKLSAQEYSKNYQITKSGDKDKVIKFDAI